MTEKGGKTTEINAILKELTQQGWLNDRDLAARFVEGQQARGYGPAVIKMKLKQKAGPLEIEIRPSTDALRDFIQRKYARHLPDNREKVIAALLRRGHTYQDIKEALDD